MEEDLELILQDRTDLSIEDCARVAQIAKEFYRAKLHGIIITEFN